ncbi:hypothetical protein DFS33DRAFT_560643 [Desarmillaria ectypa]|nr:hypothetical protein DFS33DRAFT_560643 [Desarmillaria ectypa]
MLFALDKSAKFHTGNVSGRLDNQHYGDIKQAIVRAHCKAALSPIQLVLSEIMMSAGTDTWTHRLQMSWLFSHVCRSWRAISSQVHGISIEIGVALRSYIVPLDVVDRSQHFTLSGSESGEVVARRYRTCSSFPGTCLAFQSLGRGGFLQAQCLARTLHDIGQHTRLQYRAMVAGLIISAFEIATNGRDVRVSTANPFHSYIFLNPTPISLTSSISTPHGRESAQLPTACALFENAHLSKYSMMIDDLDGYYHGPYLPRSIGSS